VYSNRARLIQIVGVALEPDRQGNAEIVLQHIEPVNRRNGFMAQVDLKAVPEGERRLVQNVLNAGMTVSAVMRNDSGGAPGGGLLARVRRRPVSVETTFLVHSDLFKTLLLYRAGASTAVAAGVAERPLAEAAPIRASLGPSSAAIRPDHLLTNGRSGNGLAHAVDAALAARFRQELMAAMGLTPAALDGIWQPETAELALVAATVLRRQARNRLALSTELRLVESDLRQALEQEQDAIAARHHGDSHALALLRELVVEIDRRIPALMLLPDAGLIERLIFALEEAHAEDRLSDEEHLLLNRLQKLKGDLERMNPKDSAAWRSIARQLERLSDPAVSPTHPAEDGKHH
jgi:hypothetical protein